MAKELTEQQRTLLRQITAGQSNKQIAHNLGKAESTIQDSLARLYRKLGVPNRTAAAVWWFKQGSK